MNTSTLTPYVWHIVQKHGYDANMLIQDNHVMVNLIKNGHLIHCLKTKQLETMVSLLKLLCIG